MISRRFSDLNTLTLIIVFTLIIAFLITARYFNPPVKTITRTITSMATVTTTSPIITTSITTLITTSTVTTTETLTSTTTVTAPAQTVTVTVTQILTQKPTLNASQRYAVLFSGKQFFVLPQCNITSNPYGSENLGVYGLLNCIAITYGALAIVVKFYLPPSGSGVILGFSSLI